MYTILILYRFDQARFRHLLLILLVITFRPIFKNKTKSCSKMFAKCEVPIPKFRYTVCARVPFPGLLNLN